MPESQQIAATVWALVLGSLFFAIIYFTVRSGWFGKGVHDIDLATAQGGAPPVVEPVDAYPEDLAEGHGRVPFILKGIIVGYVIFLIFYVVYFVQALNGPLGTLDKFLTM